MPVYVMNFPETLFVIDGLISNVLKVSFWTLPCKWSPLCSSSCVKTANRFSFLPFPRKLFTRSVSTESRLHQGLSLLVRKCESPGSIKLLAPSSTDNPNCSLSYPQNTQSSKEEKERESSGNGHFSHLAAKEARTILTPHDYIFS